MKTIRTNCKITIDGPAGSGKSSLAKLLSENLNLVHLDTGALYRSIALFFIENYENHNELTDEEIQNNFPNIKIEYGVDKILLNGVDVTTKIRTNIVSQNASIFASNPLIRDFCNVIQQNIIKNTSNIIMDGRDCGTVIMPQADYKFFLKTSPRVRAIRRLKDQGEELTDENIEYLTNEITERDNRDENREIAPLKPALDAVIIDNSNETLEETYNKIILEIKN